MPEWLVNIGIYFWGLFKLWLTTIFVAPFKTTDMLWLLVPVWIGWFFAEFFQEKIGTSMGNAISNSVIIIWGSIDCTRQTVNFLLAGMIVFGWNVVLRFLIILCLLAYGVTIVVLGIKGNKIIKYIGRVREVTYTFAIFAPVFYNEMALTLNHVIAGILFFPIFYFTIELIDRYTPNPTAVVEDMEEGAEGGAKKGEPFSGFGEGGGESKGFDSGLGGKGKGEFGDLGDFKI